MPSASGSMLFLQPNTPVQETVTVINLLFFHKRVSNKHFFSMLTELSSESHLEGQYWGLR